MVVSAAISLRDRFGKNIPSEHLTKISVAVQSTGCHPAAHEWWHAGLQTVSTQHQRLSSFAVALGLSHAQLPVA